MGDKLIRIHDKYIGEGHPPFVVMEIGCNFEGDLDRAKEMINVSAKYGASAVKFQTFIAENITTKSAPKFWDIEGCPGNTQYEEFMLMPKISEYDYARLKGYADSLGIIMFSTPEDEESLRLLVDIDIQMLKVSSMNITNHPLLRKIANTGKPIILSTGASYLYEIAEAVEVLKKEGNNNIMLLHCISHYPTRDDNVNLNMMMHLMGAFPDLIVGYSDHTITNDTLLVPTLAVAMGAKIIEKHFTFDKRRPGYDHEISFDYDDLNKFMGNVVSIGKIQGQSIKGPISCEEKTRKNGRRSLVSIRDIKKGEIIQVEDIMIKRPGGGIEPKYLDIVVGRIARKDIRNDELLTWAHI